jgi:hypothetical protein
MRTRPRGRALWAATAISTLLIRHAARADEPAPAPASQPAAESQPSDDDADTGLSPEEQAEFDKATKADSAAMPASVAPAGGGRAVQSLNPDLSLITDVALAWHGGGPTLEQGGHDAAENGFNLQALELSINHTVDPYLRFDSNIVIGKDGVEIEEAYGTTLALPYKLQARAGQFFTRFGRLNATHPHAWDFVDQPFALTRVFGGDGNRGLGLELSWLTPLPWYAELVVSATDSRGASTNRSFHGADTAEPGSPADFEWLATLSQFWELGPNLSLMWGLSSATASNAQGGRTEVTGTDVYLKYRPITRQSDTIVSLQSEWLWRHRGVSGGSLDDVNGYAQVFWRFARRWGVAGRWEAGGAPSVSGGLVSDTLDPEWIGLRQRAAGSLTFWPTEFSRLRLQAWGDFAAWQDASYGAALSIEYVVGAHGAHKF